MSKGESATFDPVALRNAASSELSQLGRVSHRLASTEGGKDFERVLSLLLPRLLNRIGSNHRRTSELKGRMTGATGGDAALKDLKAAYDGVHAKLVEMMGHIMKRVRADRNCRVPCESLLGMLYENEKASPRPPSSHDPFTLNLSLAFLTMGLPRCPAEEVEAMLPGLFSLVGAYTGSGEGRAVILNSPARRNQASQVALLALRAAEAVVAGSSFGDEPTSGGGMGAAGGGRPGRRPPPSSALSGRKAEVKEEVVKSDRNKYIKLVQRACRDSSTGAAMYDLFLDALLYQPLPGSTSAALPCPGLSQSGYERLRMGASDTSKNWAAEHAATGRLRDLKLRILDIVAPCRRWATFLGEKDEKEGADDTTGEDAKEENRYNTMENRGDSDNDANSTVTDGNADVSGAASHLGTARTVALLIAAAGDRHPDVAERAKSYMKAHIDSMRGKNASDALSALLGDPASLSSALLSLCLGESAAAGLLARRGVGGTGLASLGVEVPLPTGSTLPDVRTALLSTKRRKVSDAASASIMVFVSSKVLDDTPRLFDLTATTEENDGTPTQISARSVASLALAVCGSHLEQGGGAGVDARTAASAAKLLNSLAVRLASLHDALEAAEHEIEGGAEDMKDTRSLLSRSLTIASAVLSSAASAPQSMGERPGAVATSATSAVEMRDACYGVICSAARSGLGSAPGGALFDKGITTLNAAEMAGGKRPRVPTATASLLFGCASNEAEVLRPRAAAALDALLAAHCRLLPKKEGSAGSAPVIHEEGGGGGGAADQAASLPNPWGQTPPEEASRRNAESGGPDLQALSRSLMPLLWAAARTTQPKASRLAAARWSAELIKPLDLPGACHMMCFLAGDPDNATASIAREGLSIGSKIEEVELADLSGINHEDGSLPDFEDLVDVLFRRLDDATPRTSLWRPSFHDFSNSGWCAALRLGLTCLFSDIYGGEDGPVDVYVSAVASTLSEYQGRSAGRSRDATDLLDEAALCLAGCLAASQYARKKMALNPPVCDGASASEGFGIAAAARLALSASSSRARRHLAEACGHAYEDWTLWRDAQGSGGTGGLTLVEWVDHCRIGAVMAVCSEKLGAMQTNLHMAGEVHGAAYLGSTCVRALRLASLNLGASPHGESEAVDCCWGSAAAIVSSLGRGTQHSDEAVGNACSNGLSIAFSYDGLDAPRLEEKLFPGTSGALTSLERALHKYGNGDHADPVRASSLARATGVVLAASTSGAGSGSGNLDGKGAAELIPMPVGLGRARLLCVSALFALLGSTSYRKDTEIGLIVGEALGSYADAYSPEGATWTQPQRERPDVFDQAYAAELPPHKHVIYVLLEKETKSSSPQKRTACAPVILALVGRTARMLHNNLGTKSRAFIREIITHLLDFQTAAISLLADPKSKQLALAACRGISVVASSQNDPATMGQNIDDQSTALNDRLLRAFGQTTNYAGSAYMETRTQNMERIRQENRNRGSNGGEGSAASMVEEFGMETEIQETGGASGMGEAALGAYREMAGAAVSLGRPDVLYSLMLLSVTHPLWQASGVRDRYSSSSLLGKSSETGANMVEMQRSLRPHLGSLIPRLLRACNDPNKQTAEQMRALWSSLTGGGVESRSAISDHLIPTIDTLVGDAINKLWRARAGACGALSEVIVSRSWQELGGGKAVMDDDDVDRISVGSKSSAGVRLLRLWKVTTRALDDVRLTVRESGEVLARSVRSLTVRLCDPSAAESTDRNFPHNPPLQAAKKAQTEAGAAAAAATALRWLVKYGLNQPCAEATGFCVSCLLGVVDVAKPSTLQPILPELIGSLLMAMSGLEPAALNYLQVRASGEDSGSGSGPGGPSRYDQLERLRLQMVQSGPIASTLNKCLSMVRHISVDSQKKVIPQLDSALRCGAGFATRAAAADAVSYLCSTCPSSFKFSNHSSANPSVRLLRALYFASEREHGSAAKDKMAHALGSLAEWAPGHSVRVLAARACERYSNLQGSNDDPAARRAAAAALRAIAVRASSQFADGGSNNIWCAHVLPLAFLGKKDDDPKVASLWKEVWDEGGAVANVGTSGKYNTLEENLLPHLVRGCIDALNDVSWSRRVAACAALTELSDMEILSPAPRPIHSSRTKEVDKNILLRSRRRAQSSSAVLSTCVRLIVKIRVWRGKAELVKTTAKVAGKWACLGEKPDHIWGWDQDQEGKQCPWIPVIQVIKSTPDDLFVDDGWFTKTSSHTTVGAVSDTEPEDISKVEEDVSEDAPLDFSDEDAMIGDNETPVTNQAINTPADEEGKYTSLVFSGLARVLLDQGLPPDTKLTSPCIDEDELPFRSSALQALSYLLQSCNNSNCQKHAKYVYRKVLAPGLINQIESSCIAEEQKTLPPLIVARSIECLSGAMWNGMGIPNGFEDIEDVSKLASLLCELCGSNQPAWTVREASALAASSLVSNSALEVLRKHKTIETLLICTKQTSADRKFWRVRCAGLKLLRALVSCGGSSPSQSFAKNVKGQQSSDANTNQNQQLMLEALLPFKEQIVKFAKAGLRDNESNVTAVAADICSAISWWP